MDAKQISQVTSVVCVIRKGPYVRSLQVSLRRKTPMCIQGNLSMCVPGVFTLRLSLQTSFPPRFTPTKARPGRDFPPVYLRGMAQASARECTKGDSP